MTLQKQKYKGTAYYKKLADQAFSKYIRYRDGQKFYNEDTGQDEWFTQCLLCSQWHPFNKTTTVHFVDKQFIQLRWDEFNVNASCLSCSRNVNKLQLKNAISLKYGTEIAKNLEGFKPKKTNPTPEKLKSYIEVFKKDILAFS